MADDKLPPEAEMLQPCEMQVKTKPHEYAKALRTIMKMHPKMTIQELSTKVGRTIEWIEEKLKITEEVPMAMEPLEIFWDNRHGRSGLYELRAHPAAMLMKVRKMSGGGWLVNCLGEAASFPGELSDEQAKNAAIGWMLPLIERLKGSLNALHTK